DAAGRPARGLRGIGGENRRGVRTRGTQWARDRRGDGRPEPRPSDVVRVLRGEELLPAIYFFFSRRECELAAQYCAPLGLARTTEAHDINKLVDERLSALSHDDRSLGQVALLRRLLPLGVGFHH